MSCLFINLFICGSDTNNISCQPVEVKKKKKKKKTQYSLVLILILKFIS